MADTDAMRNDLKELYNSLPSKADPSVESIIKTPMKYYDNYRTEAVNNIKSVANNNSYLVTLRGMMAEALARQAEIEQLLVLSEHNAIMQRRECIRTLHVLMQAHYVKLVAAEPGLSSL